MINTSILIPKENPIVIPAIYVEDTTGLWTTQKEDPKSPFRVRQFEERIVLPNHETPTKETNVQAHRLSPLGWNSGMEEFGGEAEVRNRHILTQHQIWWLVTNLPATNPPFWNFFFTLDENDALAYMQADWRESLDWRVFAAPIRYQVCWGSSSMSGEAYIFLRS